MDKALLKESSTDAAKVRALDWRKRMSDHVAFALLVYTGLQIVSMQFIHSGSSGSLMPYFALIVLVAAIIPGARWIEGRWSGLSDEAAADPALAGDFKRDRLALWLCAIGLPVGLTGIFKGVEALF